MVKVTGTTYRPLDFRWVAVLLGLVLAACNLDANSASTGEASANPEVTTQLFEGFYASGPEMSSYVTCAMGELPGPGKGYWLIPNDEFSQLYENPKGITIIDIAGTYGPYDVFAVYVRFEGILSTEPGKGYGHLGLYIGEIQVTRALAANVQFVGSRDPQRQFFIGCGP